MPIRVRCAGCEKLFKVADKYAGKRLRCPECQAILKVPPAVPPAVPAEAPPPVPKRTDPDDDDSESETYALTRSSPESASDETAEDDGFPDDVEQAAAPVPRASRRPRVARPSAGTFVPAAHELPPSRVSPTARRKGGALDDGPLLSAGGREHLFWGLLLALLPLAISTVFAGVPVEERIQETIRQHPEIAGRLENAGSSDAFFSMLPGQRIVGAHLSRGTYVHWFYAGLSAVLFLALLTQVFPTRQAGPSRLFWTGVATGTVGIFLLLAFQLIAFSTYGFPLRGRGIVILILAIIKFIGFSYRAALDPQNGFLLSFAGFTFGVGLCEELCKAIPIVIFLRRSPHAGWKAACLVGMASGVGFGVSEGITYSADSYNGIATGITYLVRFASCVALHAMWAGAVGLVMCRNQDYLGEGGFETSDALNFVLYYLSMPMVLHGLYDTLLKQDHALLALAVAALTFGWLAWLVWRSRSEE